MHKYTLRTETEGQLRLVKAGDKILFRFPMVPKNDDIANFGRPNQKGASDIEARLVDMKKDGIDAEIIFPTNGMMTFLLENTEAELAAKEQIFICNSVSSTRIVGSPTATITDQ